MEKVVPLCPYFGSCGGCSGQHISYETQLHNKKTLLLTHLKKNGIADLSDAPILFSNPYSYRNRMDFAFSSSGISLRKKEQYNSFVPIEKCAISNDRINSLIGEVQRWFDSNKDSIFVYSPKERAGCIKYATIRAQEHTDSSSITFILNEESPKVREHIELITQFSLTSSAKNVSIATVPAASDVSTSHEAWSVKGSLQMEEKLLGKTLLFSSQGFFQNNTVMAEKMIQFCRDHFLKKDRSKSILIDLYGGAATFGVGVGDLFEKIVIIDHEGPNIVFAKENLLKNSIKAETYGGDAGILSRLHFPAGKDIILLSDPPRSGMGEKVIRRILSLDPSLFVYISCNPMLMAKELRHFSKRYELIDCAVFDLFPQTIHTEAIAILRRKE